MQFENLIALVELSMNHNLLEEILIKSFCLRYLDVSFNKIKKIESRLREIISLN